MWLKRYLLYIVHVEDKGSNFKLKMKGFMTLYSVSRTFYSLTGNCIARACLDRLTAKVDLTHWKNIVSKCWADQAVCLLPMFFFTFMKYTNKHWSGFEILYVSVSIYCFVIKGYLYNKALNCVCNRNGSPACSLVFTRLLNNALSL